ncbi:MAG: pantoate--beta-alanine ligase [Bacteroidota bacterium]
MKIIRTVAELRELVTKTNLSPLGFVPTMGALHKGHLSLAENAVAKCPVVIVSIYVNPMQFNDREDLKNYPRPIERDLELLGSVLRQNDIVFTPVDSEMYPSEDIRVFSFGSAGKVMEALHRPGHFNGVAKVVSRFFDIINPDLAFFGQKDFQQVTIIKELVRQKKYKVKIIVNPIIREADGLAMSSRNILLKPEDRKKAPVIFKTISLASEMLTLSDIPEIKDYVAGIITREAGFTVEYFEVADDRKLIPLITKKEMKKGRRYYGCIAVRAGKIRLIDNIEFPLV